MNRFVAWLEAAGYASYDPYDVWGTRHGLWARRIYYERGRMGAPLVFAILFLETFAPGLRTLFVKKQRYATADAQLILAFLKIADSESRIADRPTGAPDPTLAPTGGEGRGEGETQGRAKASSIQYPVSSIPFLEKAIGLADELLNSSVPGFRGYCWGYPFDWQNNKGLWPRNTPYITCTPYAFEAFLGLFDAVGEKRHLDIAASIARFVADDLKDTPCGPDAAAASYSPFDDSKVVNASAYRAFVLFEAVWRLTARTTAARSDFDPGGAFVGPRESMAGATQSHYPLSEHDRQRYLDKARRNLNFILENQRDDGSWLYAIDNPAEAYIDHFHTCFVLKNLVKINRHLRNPRVTDAIHRGYAFYRRHLFDGHDMPKPFAIRPRTQIVRLEMYDVAEAITLGVLLRDEIPEAFELAHKLARRVGERYQLPDGHFVTRVYRGGLRHTFPFLRWPQAQLFYALTNLWAALAGTRSSASATHLPG